MCYLKYVSQDMTEWPIISKLIEDIVTVAAYTGVVILITKNQRNQAHACTVKKAETCTPYSTKRKSSLTQRRTCISGKLVTGHTIGYASWT